MGFLGRVFSVWWLGCTKVRASLLFFLFSLSEIFPLSWPTELCRVHWLVVGNCALLSTPTTLRCSAFFLVKPKFWFLPPRHPFRKNAWYQVPRNASSWSSRAHEPRWRTPGLWQVSDKRPNSLTRYLGLLYQQDCRWNKQLEVALTLCRVALGGLKIMAHTVGFHNPKYLLNLFDATVSSIYRYGLGIWGVLCAQVNKLDNLFVEFVCWAYRLPSKTGKFTILANFARRCAKCDALYLAAVQIAKASVSKTTSGSQSWKTYGQGWKGPDGSRSWNVRSRSGVSRVRSLSTGWILSPSAKPMPFFCPVLLPLSQQRSSGQQCGSGQKEAWVRDLSLCLLFSYIKVQISPAFPDVLLAIYRWLSVQELS